MSADEREELGVSRDELEQFGAMDPPPGFADRVLAATTAPVVASAPAPRARRRALVLAALAGAALAAAAALAFVATRGPSFGGNGSLVAEERTTADVGGRALAVAETGAALEWRVDGDGRADVEQTAGDVFYRVEPGPEMEITTALGTVSVLGTCLRVEVIEMRRALTGAAAGAALTAAVLVTVYEGRVAVANDEGRATIEAGERALLSASGAPSRVTGGDDGAGTLVADDPPPLGAEATPAELAAANAALRARSAEQRLRIAELEGRLGAITGSPDGEHRPLGQQRWWPASSEELRALAEECTLRLDQPPVSGMTPGELDDLDDLGATSEERAVLSSALAELHRSYAERMRELYVEATGDADGAAGLSPQAMLAEIEDKAPPSERRVWWRIGRERAGLAVETPPDERSVSERAVRLFAGIGDEYQTLVARDLGDARARELRSAGGGWPWNRSQFSGCGPE